MDYKKILKSRKLRVKIMQFLNFIPDKQMVQLQYRIKTGNKLDLKNPKRFTEKLQWYKLYYRDPLMAQCVDKYEVRKYVEKVGLGYILNELYGVYDLPDEIDFDKLPNSFVLKDTLGGGGNSVIIVKDKEQIDFDKIRVQMSEWVNEPTNKKNPGREWVYDGKKHRIIAEKFIDSDADKGGLIDYKFFCFNGNHSFGYILTDREFGKSVNLGIFESNTFNLINAIRCDEKPLERIISKPLLYDKMLEIASRLSKPFPEARIDLYCVDSSIYFGEITFFDGSGYMKYSPDSFDYELGRYFELEEME
jgi:hypothetical protein